MIGWQLVYEGGEIYHLKNHPKEGTVNYKYMYIQINRLTFREYISCRDPMAFSLLVCKCLRTAKTVIPLNKS
jgi:hypothetical protein